MRETEICNAKITGTQLGSEDHGIMTFYLWIEFGGGGCGYGGYALDGYDQATKKRVAPPVGMQVICEVMDCIGVTQWEKIPGTYIRVEHEGPGGRITRIGNLMEDKWLSLEEFFEAAQKEKSEEVQ